MAELVAVDDPVLLWLVVQMVPGQLGVVGVGVGRIVLASLVLVVEGVLEVVLGVDSLLLVT